MKKLKIAQGKFAIVDDEYYEFLSQWNWTFHKLGYAYRTQWHEGKCVSVYMHRIVNNTPDGMGTDHINGDRLDNRKANLRTCNGSQNSMNRSHREGCSSRHKGVCWHKRAKKWLAYIKMNGVQKHLGVFISEQDAALAYNKAALEMFGEFALLNEI